MTLFKFGEMFLMDYFRLESKLRLHVINKCTKNIKRNVENYWRALRERTLPRQRFDSGVQLLDHHNHFSLHLAMTQSIKYISLND